MDRFKFIKKMEVEKLPKEAGVYCFKKGKEILYIGKASSLKERIKNHFLKSSYRDNLFIEKVKKIGYIKTASEIEALILEANLIKNINPRYNILWKDDKNYFFVGITKESFPIVFWTHQTKLRTKNSKLKTEYIGPFVEGAALKKTLIILRKIFPYYSLRKHPKMPCPWCQLKLCPGPNPDKKEYRKNIKNLISVLKGKKKSVLKNLKREMENLANLQDFEKAAKIRDQIKALEKVLSHAKIFDIKQVEGQDWEEIKAELKKIFPKKDKISRIEAYDVSNIQGKWATGSMITFMDGQKNKNFYRKFKTRIEGKPNDVAMIKEILGRRMKHQEWGFPDLILIDGGKAQLNAVFSELKKLKKNILILALAKRKKELFMIGEENPILLKNLTDKVLNFLLRVRDEAHRFAISYHKRLREKALIGK